MTYEEAAQILGVAEDEEDEAVLRKAFRRRVSSIIRTKNPGTHRGSSVSRIGQALEMLVALLDVARGDVVDYDDDDTFAHSFFRRHAGF